MAEQPNDASRKSKAEDERWSPESEDAGAGERSGYDNTDDQAAGISNRTLDEERENQEALPRRGESKAAAHGSQGDRDDRRSER